jgi:hypothetical protein
MKKIVYYSGDYTIRPTADGYYAILNVVDHPNVRPGHVITSKLRWIDFELGTMETQNSLYKPVEENDARSDS